MPSLVSGTHIAMPSRIARRRQIAGAGEPPCDHRTPAAGQGDELIMRKTTTSIAVRLALGATLMLGCASGARAADANDAWITTKAKIALLTTNDLGATGIDVDTIDGKVTLHGSVATASEKTRAETVAKDIKGVRSVNNLLQVVAPKNEERVEAKDEQIEDRVEKALASDQRLRGSDIDVASVNNGVVLLRGKADSLNDHLEALNVAGKVSGVRRVESEIQSPDSLAADDTSSAVKSAASDAADKGKQTVAATGAVMGDAYVTSATKMRLLADRDTPATDINVDTRDGVVTLFGIVPSAAAKQAAEANARKVSGVKDVHNELQVVADAKRDAVDAKDEDIERGVEKTLASSSSTGRDDIDVEVKDGVVRLTGSVPSESDRLAAGFAARKTPGVRAVLVDDLQIEKRG
jgi:hyperosmotically inducible protein